MVTTKSDTYKCMCDMNTGYAMAFFGTFSNIPMDHRLVTVCELENGPVEIIALPTINGMFLSTVVLVYLVKMVLSW